ncbi:hypothetical protein HN018_00905 [Lichenicola cladoniae]|uniref:Glycosyltransferase RgtA/B/C/D-like domain-containing protein n=1 Tax=Lichenicola cladoniae TaxID=1484109 RepID=A0A6M8H5F8_9PROT|nr:hypothetical protein [Lichenicola cladoniae]NPD65203.1 hypothetical protein [Acetobacteraceae bacterium]QKE88801.1 hypothetical protein HN018_00905 [Lichenicola cladoniae]
MTIVAVSCSGAFRSLRLGYVLRRSDILLLVAAAMIVFFLAGPVLTMPLRIPLSYNEGWNAYFGARAMDARLGPLYPGSDSLVFNNYPPLSFYIVGVLGRYVVGDLIVAGRIVALTSLLASAGLLGVCVRLLGGTVRGGLAAAALLLLYTSTFYRDYVAVDDPQWLAHALMLGALAMLLTEYRAARYPVGRVMMAALLMTAGGFVKHSLVGLPVAVTIWLFLVQPRTARVWLISAIGWVSLGLIVTEILHGGAAFLDILEHHRVFRLGRAVKAFERLLPLLPLMIVATLTYRARRQGDRPIGLAALFVVISLLGSLAQRFGEGVNYNAYFETMIALCLTLGLALSARPTQDPSVRRRLPSPGQVVGLACIPLLVMMPWQIGRAWGDIDGRFARARSWQPIILQLARQPGLVGCETLSLCFWAGKPFAVDMFNLNQDILTGGSIARFDALAGHHAFGLFEFSSILTVVNGHSALKHDPLLENLLAHGYAVHQRGPEGSVVLGPPLP